MGVEDRRPVVVITHHEYFSAIDGRHVFATKRTRTGHLDFKVSSPFDQLNLASSSREKREEVVEKTGLIYTEVLVIFEYC